MAIYNEENILKLLYSYNPWWKDGVISKDIAKEMKRFVYFEAKSRMLHSDIRRTVVLSGARRTGKTTIMYQIIDSLIESGVRASDVLFISFDHPLLKMCSVDKILDVYYKNITSSKKLYLFFDEIQYAEDWDSWLKILYDTNPDYRMMATGSASPMFHDRGGESGLGRWTVLQVPTFSFYEYCDLLKIDTPILPVGIKPTQLYALDRQEQSRIIHALAHLQSHFIRYLQVGGFPELAISKDDFYAQRVLREDIVDKAIKRDLPNIYQIRNVTNLEKVFLYLCYNSSSIINLSTMAKELEGVSRETIENYIKYLESANLIYVNKPVDISGKKILKSQQKVYIADAALRNAVLMNNDIVLDSTEMGIIVETAVYKHIKAFYYNSITAINYYRDSTTDKEIDIVVKTVNAPSILIEVKYRENPKIKESDAIVLMQSKIPSLVITKNVEDFGSSTYNDKSIYKIPAFAFLYLLGNAEKEGYKISETE